MSQICQMKMPYKQAQIQFHVINGEHLRTLLLRFHSQVFKSTTGEKLTEIQAHDEEVLCCTFSPDDRLLATCSSDRKIKVSATRPGFSCRSSSPLQDCFCPCDCQVWNVERAMLLRVFEEEHEEQVNHCQFTNTAHRLLLATCSNDKFLNVKVAFISK